MSRRKIQHLRGEEGKLPDLDVAELAFTTDTEKLFVGGASGNTEIAKKEDLDAIKSRVINITDIPGATFSEKMLNSMSRGVKYLRLEEYAEYTLTFTDGVIYNNITILGNNATIRTSHKTLYDIGSNVHFKNVHFVDNSPDDNNSLIQLTNGSSNNSFIECTFSTTLTHVFRLFGMVENLLIEGCTFENCNTGLTFYREFKNIIMRKNTFLYASGNVISGVGEETTPEMIKQNFIFEDNIVNYCGRMIIEIKRSNGIIVRNNIFDYNEYFVASLIGCNDILIDGNIVKGGGGIEIGAESDLDFPTKNVRILNNDMRECFGNFIVFNAGQINNTIQDIEVKHNRFYGYVETSGATIEYISNDTIRNITNIQVSENSFTNIWLIHVYGVFSNNQLYSNQSNLRVDAYTQCIIKDNVFSVNPQGIKSGEYDTYIKVNGNDMIIDGNIFRCESLYWTAISDSGGTRTNLTITNNKIYNPTHRAMSFQNTTTFGDVQGNSSIGTDWVDGEDFYSSKTIAHNLGLGIYYNRGNPNDAVNPNFGAFGSLCIDTYNRKLYVKENTSAPYWVLK